MFQYEQDPSTRQFVRPIEPVSCPYKRHAAWLGQSPLFGALESKNAQTPQNFPFKIVESVKAQLGESNHNGAIEQTVTEVLCLRDELSIRIPCIHVEPQVQKPGRYHPFQLDLQSLFPQAIDQPVLLQSLQDGLRHTIAAGAPVELEDSPENCLAKDLLNYDDIAETDENTEIVMNLADQMIRHLASYLKSEDVHNVILAQRSTLVKLIHAQMQAYFEQPEYIFSSKIGRDFIFLKSMYHVVPSDEEPLPYDQPMAGKSQISAYLFSGFKKSQYAVVKFHSDSERLFACVLEQDSKVLKWVRPARDALSLFYHKDIRYEPDFVVETEADLFLCEVRSSAQLEDPVVLKKAGAAQYWCDQATAHARQNQAKPWRYLLIPHNEIHQTASFHGYVQRFTCISTPRRP